MKFLGRDWYFIARTLGGWNFTFKICLWMSLKDQATKQGHRYLVWLVVELHKVAIFGKTSIFFFDKENTLGSREYSGNKENIRELVSFCDTHEVMHTNAFLQRPRMTNALGMVYSHRAMISTLNLQIS